jgi:glycosyltransferase involved in cell wall biosynthesis
MGSSEQPFFSILIPSYNRPECISQCIDSVLANEAEEFEIIISDDASPKLEAIANAVRPYLSRGNIQFHQKRANIGEPANRNFLVSQASGQYNIILCDDDQLFPHALRTIRAYIERVPNQDLYMFGYRVINAFGIKCYDRVAPKPFTISLDEPYLVRRMFEATWLPFLVCHPATFCCKAGVESEIPYRQDVSTADDYMFLLECLNKGKRMYVIPECLMTYRWAKGAQIDTQANQSADDLAVIKAYTDVYYAMQNRTGWHPSVSGFVHGGEYRKRFLYDLIIRRKLSLKNTLAQVGLLPVHREELALYATRRSKLVVSLKTGLEIVRELTHVFGVKGFLYFMQIGRAFLRHRVLAT